MNTMIISAFPGCGKTYLYKNQSKLTFKYLGRNKVFTFSDSDSSQYKKNNSWEKRYVDEILTKIGTVDFIFISQHESVLKELYDRKIPFIVVAPDNSEWISDSKRQLIKQQWFGRFILRKNEHIINIEDWLNSLKENYDKWTSIEHITKYNPVSFFLLDESQYLTNIIADLYWKKETYVEKYCSKQKIR